jgi:hypothetical protein
MIRQFSSLLLTLVSSALVATSQPVAQPSTASASLNSNYSQKTRVTYRTYSNARYKYSISYPVGILEPQGEPDNGDGQKFTSKDGRAELIVYGANNIDNETTKSEFDKAVKEMGGEAGRVVTYKVMKKNWFVISGRHDKNIFYSKTINRGDTLITFIFEYPESESATFDAITTRIANSFSG